MRKTAEVRRQQITFKQVIGDHTQFTLYSFQTKVLLSQTPVNVIWMYWFVVSCSESGQIAVDKPKGKSVTLLAYFCNFYVQDSSYIQQLSIPMAGLTLKTRVFAAVKASNLDRRYKPTSSHSVWTNHQTMFTFYWLIWNPQRSGKDTTVCCLLLFVFCQIVGLQ